LDNSVEVKIGRSPRRVGIDVNGDFCCIRSYGWRKNTMVMLDLGRKMLQVLKPLSDKMKSALIKA